MSSKPDSSLLFVYGTLRDPLFRRALLGHVRVLGRAQLDAHALMHADGWVFVRAADSSQAVPGLVLELDPDQLARADAWEDAPVTYQRRQLAPVIVADDKSWTPTCVARLRQGAWVYVRDHVAGSVAAHGAYLGSSRADVLLEIGRTLAVFGRRSGRA